MSGQVQYYFGAVIGCFLIIVERDWFHHKIEWWAVLIYIPVWALLKLAIWAIGKTVKRSRLNRARAKQVSS